MNPRFRATDMDRNDARPSAIVTGASSGIGAVFAERLAARGCDVRIVARRGDRLRALADRLHKTYGVDVAYDVADLSEESTLDAWVQSILDSGRPPHWLVNNAGFGAHTAAFQPLPWFGAYAATKSHVLHFTEALAIELRGRVVVTALCPGQTKTEFVGSANMDGRFDSAPAMTAEAVVDAALRASDRGRSLCVPGLLNKVQTFLSMKMPRALVKSTATRLFRR
jgi:uncharacterized protein